MSIIDGSDLLSAQGKDKEKIKKWKIKDAKMPILLSENNREARKNPYSDIHSCKRNVRHLKTNLSVRHLSTKVPSATGFLQL
jgi:hypothetical protein